MSEPLAIAAGTVGILSGAITLTGELGEFIRDLRNAPEHVRQTGASLESAHAILKPLNQMLLRPDLEDARDLTKPICELEDACSKLKDRMKRYPSRHGRASLLTLNEKFRWWRHKKDIRRLQEQIERAQGGITVSLSKRIFKAVGENAEHQAEMRHLMHELRDLAKRQRAQGSSVRSDDGHTLVEVSSKLQFTINKWRRSIEPPVTATRDAGPYADQFSSPRSSVVLSPASSIMGMNTFKVPEYPLRPSGPVQAGPRNVNITSAPPTRHITIEQSNRNMRLQPTPQRVTGGPNSATTPAIAAQPDLEHRGRREPAMEDGDSGYSSVSPILRTGRPSENQAPDGPRQEPLPNATRPRPSVSVQNSRSFAGRRSQAQTFPAAPTLSAPYNPDERQQRYRNVMDDQGRVAAIPVREPPRLHQVRSAPTTDILEATRYMDPDLARTYIDGLLAGMDRNIAQTISMSRSAMTLDQDRSFWSPGPRPEAAARPSMPPIPEARNITSSRGRHSLAVYRDPQVETTLAESTRTAESQPRLPDPPKSRVRPNHTNVANGVNNNSGQTTARTSQRPDQTRPSPLAPLEELPPNEPANTTTTQPEDESKTSRRVARHSRERRRRSQDENAFEAAPATTPREALRSSTAAALMASTSTIPDFNASRRLRVR